MLSKRAAPAKPIRCHPVELGRGMKNADGNGRISPVGIAVKPECPLFCLLCLIESMPGGLYGPPPDHHGHDLHRLCSARSAWRALRDLSEGVWP